MKINSNTTAVITNNYLLRSENALSKSSERLSSGYKINKANDNPAGYAISSKMRAQIKALEKATDNADQGIDFVQTGEGAIVEITEMVQRMNELAVKAANGTMTTADREAIQSEVDQLVDEIDRISSQTLFNDQPILDGNFEYRGYTYDKDAFAGDKIDHSSAKAKVATNIMVTGISDETRAGAYSVEVGTVKADGSVKVTIPGLVPGEDELEGNYDSERGELTVSASDGTKIVLDFSDHTAKADISKQKFALDIPKIGAMRVQVGANEGQIIEMNIPEISSRKLKIDDLDVTTQDSARKAIDTLADSLSYVSAVRSKFGAYQNRMEHAIASLDVTVESTNAAYSTLVDTDMASEMTEYTKLQVLQQAGTSMLAQANEFPQQALQLLQ